jgi:hypothetical protein
LFGQPESIGYVRFGVSERSRVKRRVLQEAHLIPNT